MTDNSKMMKAWTASDYDGIEGLKLVETDVPRAGAGELVLELVSAAINPLDIKLLHGYLKQLMPLHFPFIPGNDCAGRVVEVGDGIEGYAAGDLVCAMSDGAGAFAQYVMVTTGPKTARVPSGVSAEIAAALPEAGLTAMTVLRALPAQAGKRLGILGSAGGVGSFLVQLASRAGFEVIATSRLDDENRMRSYGASEVVVYDDVDVRQAMVDRYPEGLDMVVDLVYQAEDIIETGTCVRTGGAVISTLFGPPKESFAKLLEVKYVQVSPRPGDLESLLTAAGEDRLKVPISVRYSFSDAKAAMLELRDGRVRGKIVISALD